MIQLPLFEDNHCPAELPRKPIAGTIALVGWRKPPVAGGYVVIETFERPVKIFMGFATQVIWGSGASVDAALEDALRWVSVDDRYTIRDRYDLKAAVNFQALPCTRAVIRDVERYGGEIKFEIVDGLVVLESEKAAALQAAHRS
jgi:hypothetical protein